jgi:hypothetical protein
MDYIFALVPLIGTAFLTWELVNTVKDISAINNGLDSAGVKANAAGVAFMDTKTKISEYGVAVATAKQKIGDYDTAIEQLSSKMVGLGTEQERTELQTLEVARASEQAALKAAEHGIRIEQAGLKYGEAGAKAEEYKIKVEQSAAAIDTLKQKLAESDLILEQFYISENEAGYAQELLKNKVIDANLALEEQKKKTAELGQTWQNNVTKMQKVTDGLSFAMKGLGAVAGAAGLGGTIGNLIANWKELDTAQKIAQISTAALTAAATALAIAQMWVQATKLGPVAMFVAGAAGVAALIAGIASAVSAANSAVNRYDGGFVAAGQSFIYDEYGPELVTPSSKLGLGGQTTAVANNQMITEAIEAAAERGFIKGQMATAQMGGQNITLTLDMKNAQDSVTGQMLLKMIQGAARSNGAVVVSNSGVAIKA